MERINKFDTLKGLLIVSVLLHHIMMETNSGDLGYAIMFTTGIFRMPLFMAISGRFAKFKPMDTLFFLALFAIFRGWFILAIAVYYMLIPLFARVTDRRMQAAVIVGAVCVGLLFGFFPYADANWHRVPTFLPFFLIGYYRVFEWKPFRHNAVIFASASLLTVAAFFLFPNNIPLLLCNAYGEHHLWHRLVVYIAGTLWTAWILNVMTNRKIPIATKLGHSTLWIYLLHLPMISLVAKLTQFLADMSHIPVIPMQVLVVFAWVMLLWPVSYGLNRLTGILLRALKPINVKMQQRCMPKEKMSPARPSA